MTTPKQPGPRFCRCGCGARVEHPKHYTAACKAIVRANRYRTANGSRCARGTKTLAEPPRRHLCWVRATGIGEEDRTWMME